MGQYWMLVNLDKGEFVDPHTVGTGLKLWEQLANWPGTGTALIVLCAAMPMPRGGGDLAAAPVIGRWAGDRIALVGDYAEATDLRAKDQADKIYERCRDGTYRDVSLEVAAVIEHELGGKYTGDGWRRWSRE